jgi:formylglycine-generating enzyme required for sulfatase activity
VSWRDAVAFTEWLTARERRRGLLGPRERYRLPTEAEWEYVSRAGGPSRYAWGEWAADAIDYANVLDSTPLPDGSRWRARHFPWQDGHAFTSPVGSFRTVPLGLHDLHGNVWEWCANGFYAYPGLLQTDPAGPGDSRVKVMRGGSWDNYAGTFRCAVRRKGLSTFSSDATGFRVVLSEHPSPEDQLAASTTMETGACNGTRKSR